MLLFVVAGALHFLVPGIYERIMPTYLPLHRELVYLSGALEVTGGLGLLDRRTRRISGLGLVLLLVAKVGTVCIGDSHENALKYYQDTVTVLDREAQR